MTKDVVNLALVGCGGMMGAHENGLRLLWEKKLRRFRVLATCDIRNECAQDMANRIEAWQKERPRVYSDLDELLEKEPDVTAVDLSVAHVDHHTLATRILQTKRHLTIEKPIAMTIRAGRQIIDAAKKARRVLQVAENYRREPSERAVNWAIREGMIGNIRTLHWVDLQERLWYWGWRDELDMAGGGWTMDGGVHHADLFRYHVGEIKTLCGASKQYNPLRYKDSKKMEGPIKATIEDSTFSILQFKNGATGQWSSCISAPGATGNTRVLFGDQGCIDWNFGLRTRKKEIPMDKLVQMHHKAIGKEGREQLFPKGITDSIATELHEFFEAILDKKKVEVDGMEGLKSLAICMAIYESEALGEPVKLKDVLDDKIGPYQAKLNKKMGLPA